MYPTSSKPTSARLVGIALLAYALLGLLYWLPLDALRSAVYTYLGCSSGQPISLDWLRALEYLLVAPLLTLVGLKMSDRFVLHDKYEQSLGAIVQPLIYYSCLYRLPEFSWGVILATLAMLYLLLASYQRVRSSVPMVLVGLLVGALGVYQPQAYLLLPIVVIMLYPLRILTLRNALALLHGAVLLPIMLLPIFYVLDSSSLLVYIERWCAEWSRWLTMLPALADYPPLFLHLPWLALLAFVGLVGYVSHVQTASIRQRDMEIALIWLSIGGLVLTALVADSGGFLPGVVAFPISILVVRALNQIGGKAFILLIYAFVILAWVVALFH